MKQKILVNVNGKFEARDIASIDYIDLSDDSRVVGSVQPELMDGEIYAQTLDGGRYIVDGIK